MEYNGKFLNSPVSRCSSSRKNKQPRICLICGGKSQGSHFGAESCRACTAFFRRSVARNKKYICHHETSCHVLTNRLMCRACRLKKCIEVGMVKTAVQRYEVDMHEDLEDCPSVINTNVENIENKTPILTKMAERYKEVKKIRRELHGRRKRVPRSVNFMDADTIFSKEVGTIANFLSTSFEEIHQLKKHQRKRMFKLFLREFLVLEGEYQASIKKFTSAMILPNGDMIDFDQLETFFPSTTGSEMVSQKDAVTYYSPIFDLYKRCILEPMNQLKIDEMEFLFMCGTVFWDNCFELQSEESETLAKSIKSRLVDEIVFHLKKKKEIKEPAVRISSLMMIITSLQRVVFKLQQDIEMSHVFNVYKVDEIFYNIVNCNI